MSVRFLWLLIIGCSLAWSVESGSEPIHREAPLVVHGTHVSMLRATLFGYTPAERAALAYRRLVSLIDAGGPGVVGSREVSDGVLLTIDGADALLLVPEDANRLLGETGVEAVNRAREALTRIVSEERGPVTNERLMAAGLKVLAATGIFMSVIVALTLLRRLMQRGITYLQRHRSEMITNRDVESFLRDQLVRGLRWMTQATVWAFGVLAGYLWLTWCLAAFPWTRDVSNQLGGQLGEFSLGLLRGIGDAIPGLAIVLVIVVIVGFLSHFVKLFFVRIETRRINLGWLNHNTAVPTRRILIVILWLFAIAMMYPYLPGSGSDAFKGLSVFVGILISLGGAGLVGQVASGFILTYLGIVRVGDYVIVGTVEGVVAEIGIFNTRIETIFKEAMSVPNVFILTNTTTNLSRFPGQHGVVVQATVTIGYDVPWRQIHALLLNAAKRTSGLQQHPEPYVQQRALSDFYVEYHLCAYLLNPVERIPVTSQLYAEIQDQFNEAGVQILSPHYMQEPKKPAVVPREQWLGTSGPDIHHAAGH